MDIISILLGDHRNVEELFKAYERGVPDTGQQIVKELEMHTLIEETILYPKVAEFDAEEASHAKEEHDEVDEFIAAFKQDYYNKSLASQIKALVSHHVEEEERDMFPSVKEKVPQAVLEEMGRQAEEMKYAQ